MWGILGLVMTVNALCAEHDINEGSITAKCDGEGTITVLQYMHPITKNSRKHFDIILALQQALDLSPLLWNFEHLRGHQDAHTCYSQLNRWAQLNVQADTLAKQEVTRLINNGEKLGPTLPIPYNQCQIVFKGQEEEIIPLSSHLVSTIIDLIQREKIKKYWEKKKKFGRYNHI